MLILLPPSETKRPDGNGRPFDPSGGDFGRLAPERAQVIDALVALSADPDAAARVLKLSERQRGDIAVNAALRTAPTMPAADRYTGVLFDALDAASADVDARAWLGTHVAIQAAPFGLVGALEPIPAYRLAAGTSLPGLPPLRRIWAAPVSEALREAEPGFVLDLRSEAYRALGPVPDGIRSAYVRVVTEGEDGATRALNHFNKHAKGALTRALACSGASLGSVDELVVWGAAHGQVLRPLEGGEVALVV